MLHSQINNVKKNMKQSLTVILFLFGLSLFAQENGIVKPEMVIIANNEIITENRLGELMKEGLVKSMDKGVTQAVRDGYAKEFGNRIGDKEFIIIVEVFTESEKIENQKKVALITDQPPVKQDDGLKLHVGDLAVDFTVEMINGELVRLSELRGQVVLLNFWATWCGPCLSEFYEMPDKIIAPFKQADFVFIPISRGETKVAVSKKMLHLKEKGIDFNVGFDPNQEIWNAYATQSIPKNFVIDKNGVIRIISTGNSDGSVDKLAAEIRKLLEE